MNSPPQLRGVFPSPTNVSNFKSASRPGPRRLDFEPDSPQRVHKLFHLKKKCWSPPQKSPKKRTRRRRRRRRARKGG